MKTNKTTIFLSALFIILSLCVLSCSTTKPTQNATVMLHLLSDDGSPIAGSNIMLQNNKGDSYHQTAFFDTVHFEDIPFGDYTLMVTQNGYRPYIYQNLSVHTDVVSHSAQLSSIPEILDNIIEFGAHQWRVLDMKDDRALIISEDVLEKRAYHATKYSEDITWEHCSLRNYLNNEFINSDAFTDADRERIIQVTNINADNPWYWKSKGGANTLDRVFLLSVAEVVSYFGDSGQLAKPRDNYWINDEYNSNRMAKFNNEPYVWGTRTPSYYKSSKPPRDPKYNDCTVGITQTGFIVVISGPKVNEERMGVRPAMWIRLNP